MLVQIPDLKSLHRDLPTRSERRRTFDENIGVTSTSVGQSVESDSMRVPPVVVLSIAEGVTGGAASPEDLGRKGKKGRDQLDAYTRREARLGGFAPC